MFILFSGKGYFRGPWFVTSQDIPQQSITKTFYKQELLLSTLDDTNPLVSIVGKCSVLEFNEYISCKCTKIYGKKERKFLIFHGIILIRSYYGDTRS